MGSVYGNAAERSSVVRATEGAQLQLRVARDGALFTAGWYDAHAMEGRLFGATMGSVTTPLTFLITAANRPDAWIRVPDGTMILPVSVGVVLEDFAGTDTEIDLRIAQNDIGNGTSSAATVGPLSLRTDAPITSNCVARQLATGDATAETNPLTIYRHQVSTANAAGNDAAGQLHISREMMSYPVLVGPATIELFVAATTTQATGYAWFTWIEFAERS